VEFFGNRVVAHCGVCNIRARSCSRSERLGFTNPFSTPVRGSDKLKVSSSSFGTLRVTTSIRTTALIAILRLAVMALAARVWLTILTEYRFYFPADFSAAFLIGRESVFVGLYRYAFYAHILVGPITLILAAWLMYGGRKFGGQTIRRLAEKSHRRIGRLQAILVFGVLVPSGLVMARDAHAGPIAGLGFGGLSIMTGATMLMAVRKAVAGDLAAHQHWATCCFLCLVSPLILRISMGLSIVLGFESEAFYQFNAWASWFVPLAIYQSQCLRGLASPVTPVSNARPAKSSFPNASVPSPKAIP